jgi:hypothetical protein
MGQSIDFDCDGAGNDFDGLSIDEVECFSDADVDNPSEKASKETDMWMMIW